MTVYILFCSGEVIKASTNINELKNYVAQQDKERDIWNYANHWHRVAYEILSVYVPTGDEGEDYG